MELVNEEIFEFNINDYKKIIYNKNKKEWYVLIESDEKDDEIIILENKEISFPEIGYIDIGNFKLTLDIFYDYKNIVTYEINKDK